MSDTDKIIRDATSGERIGGKLFAAVTQDQAMTDHPCKGMTPAQRRDFELIATNQRPMGGVQTIKALKKRGLIADAPPKRVGVDQFGPVMVPDWYVPLPVHMQWCQWCSEQSASTDLISRQG